MNRTITIKGVGRLSLKPDQVAVPENDRSGL